MDQQTIEIRWTFEAMESIEACCDYIARDSLQASIRFFNKIISLPMGLKRHPRKFRMVPELMQDDIREIIYGEYRLIYRIVSDLQIDILTLHHGRRKFPKNMFEESIS